jgi:hypothetical protein
MSGWARRPLPTPHILAIERGRKPADLMQRPLHPVASTSSLAIPTFQVFRPFQAPGLYKAPTPVPSPHGALVFLCEFAYPTRSHTIGLIASVGIPR